MIGWLGGHLRKLRLNLLSLSTGPVIRKGSTAYRITIYPSFLPVGASLDNRPMRVREVVGTLREPLKIIGFGDRLCV